MCRIVGIVDFKKSLGIELEPLTILMRDSLAHGGPDDAGIYVDQNNEVAFGHRRLSVIDPSPNGHQPMSNRNRTIWITYNGEIYNFQELREELIKLGYSFNSKTDTEVLIYGYEKWGIEKLLSRLRGMFAFAIYDARENDSPKVIIVKDRFGIKPLYYYQDSNRLIFASEVKAILKSKLVPDEVNRGALVNFLQLGSVPVPFTTVKNVFSLVAGHYMIFDRNGLVIKKYWDLCDYFNKTSNVCNIDEVISKTRSLLKESIEFHLISDVPLGVFLSGGIDSSAIVALASKYRENPLTTLSIIFNEQNYNEADYARLISKKYNTNHHEVLLTGKDFFNELPKIFQAMDQPTVDGINTYFISKAAKEIGLTVVLSGIGGDEVFLGYNHFKNAKYLGPSLKLFKCLPGWARKETITMLKSCGRLFANRNLEKLQYLSDPNPRNTYLLFRGLFSPKEVQDLLEMSEKEYQDFNESNFESRGNGLIPKSFIESIDYFEFNHYLQNQILKDSDIMSMAHAIELRVPFLDHKLVEYVISLPQGLKLQNGLNKPLLVKALSNELPKEVWDRPKMGFTFPFDEWVRKECKMFKDQNLNQNYLNQKTVKRTWEGFKKGKIHWSRPWALYVMSAML